MACYIKETINTMASIQEISTSSLISTSNHQQALEKARAAVNIRQQVASEQPPKRANFAFLGKMRSSGANGYRSLKSSTTGVDSSGATYTEWNTGIQEIFLRYYDRATLNSAEHLKKLTESKDIDRCFKELTGNLAVTSAFEALPLTLAAITIPEYLGI